MHDIFQMQISLNNLTFVENNCYLYKTSSEEIITGNFSDICQHIHEKPEHIKYVRVPQSKEGMWIKMENGKSWETLQGWWLNAYNLAIKQEAAELTDSTNWKWWRTKVDKFDPQNLKVEIIDVLHFWICQCLLMSMSFDDVKRIYKQKNEVNIKRQESKYLVKDENDCKEIV